MGRLAEHLTLRELFTASERLLRELEEHLEQGYLPKLQKLSQVGANADGSSDVSDLTVRTLAQSVLAADDFTQDLCTRLDDHLHAIDGAVVRHV